MNKIPTPLMYSNDEDLDICDRVTRKYLTPDNVYDMMRENSEIGRVDLILLNGWLLSYLNGHDMRYQSDFRLCEYLDQFTEMMSNEAEWISDLTLTMLNGCSLVDNCENYSIYGRDIDVLDIEFINGQRIYCECTF